MVVPLLKEMLVDVKPTIPAGQLVVGTGGAPVDSFTYASHPLDPNEVVRSQVFQRTGVELELEIEIW